MLTFHQLKGDIRATSAKIDALTSVRFLAALYVVVYHSFVLAPTVKAVKAIATLIISLGWMSVSFFFLLSGYILAWVYLRSGQTIRKPRFYATRFARIYPILMLALLADFPCSLLLRTLRDNYARGDLFVRQTGSLIASLLLIQAWDVRLVYVDPPSWSLSVEALFYLLFPFIGKMLWRLNRRGCYLVTLVAYLLGQVIAFLSIVHLPKEFVTYSPILHLTTFSIGILIARLQFLSRERYSKGWVYGAIGFSIVAFALTCRIAADFPKAVPFMRFGLLAPMFGALIWGLSNRDTIISKALSAKWLVILGEASYGFYLIHLPVFHLFILLRVGPGLFTFVFYLTLCIVLSVASFHWFETPARRWLLLNLTAQTSAVP
jgi:peptidoglycan/LPS O-acetylase OafA/YrhL